MTAIPRRLLLNYVARLCVSDRIITHREISRGYRRSHPISPRRRLQNEERGTETSGRGMKRARAVSRDFRAAKQPYPGLIKLFN